jgi:hypothetical protein
LTVPHSRKPTEELLSAGGAYVRRRFEYGPEMLVPGDVLSADEVRKIPTANLSALVNTGRLELFPGAPGVKGALGGERHKIHVGGGKFIVVEGRQITETPITKAEADELVAAAGHTQQ